MSEGAVKEVKVTLNPTDEQALIGGKKSRRARATRKQRGGASDSTEATPETGRVQDLGGSLSPLEAAVAEGPTARIEKVDTPAGPPTGVESRASSGLGSLDGAPVLKGGSRTTEPISPLAVASSITPPATVLPSLSTTSATSAPGAVKIGGKRGAVGGAEVPTVSTVPIARIVPTKRRTGGAPAAQTLRKPKFRVGGAGSEVPGAKHGDAVPPLPGRGPGEVSPTGGAVKQTRRFKERKIRLTVKADSARKFRKSVKAKVGAMSLSEVKGLLLKKNIIKASAAEKLPEAMMRNMLRDYMLLHNTE